ncbi:MAG: hypothetical protein WB646_04715 [Steroidobacteraceae bacterium]
MANLPNAPEQNDGEQSSERSLKMQRGVSQLLFNYLPYRTVDWEDGLAIVQFGNVRLSSVWEEDRKTTLLREIGEAFNRWQARGGRIDPAFPPVHEGERFTVGAPAEIDASVMQAALICQRCGQILFQKQYGGPGAVRCTNPECNSPRVHQIPFVFVHGCGELVPITEWIPVTKQNADGGPDQVVATTIQDHPTRREVFG